MNNLITLSKSIVDDTFINVQSDSTIFFLLHAPIKILTEQEIKSLIKNYVKLMHDNKCTLKNIRKFTTDLLTIRVAAEVEYEPAIELYNRLKDYVKRIIDKGFYCGIFSDDIDYKKAKEIEDELNKFLYFRPSYYCRYCSAMSQITNINTTYIEKSTFYLHT